MSWQVIGCSVRGPTHERAGLPNQDAIGWSEEGTTATVLALADGHGSAKCFRSDVGSRLAVDAAISVLPRLFDFDDASASASAWKRIAETSLGQTIVRHWDAAVFEDVLARPFTSEEWSKLEQSQAGTARAAIEANPRIAYGSTLLAALLASSFALFFQLGDGEILVVDRDGETSRPLPGDPRLFANETTSLSGTDAWRDARIGVQMVDDAAPALILLTTDGYPNSFRSDEDFTRVAGDLADVLRLEGTDAVRTMLPDWLADATENGSGDDATVGILYRNHASPATSE